MKRRAIADETRTLRASANSAIAPRRPVTFANAVARNVYGLDSVTSTAYGPNTLLVPAGKTFWAATLRSWI